MTQMFDALVYSVRQGTVKAVQVTEDNYEEVSIWCDGFPLPMTKGVWVMVAPNHRATAQPGDYIIRFPMGNYGVIDELSFHENYTRKEDEDDSE